MTNVYVGPFLPATPVCNRAEMNSNSVDSAAALAVVVAAAAVGFGPGTIDDP